MKYLIGLILILVTGCAGLPMSPQLQTVTQADVDAAIALAQAGNDPDGLACWTAIKNAIPASGPAVVDIKGVASTIQAARNARRGVQAGVDPTVHRACAVLIVDAEQTAARLGIRLAPR